MSNVKLHLSDVSFRCLLDFSHRQLDCRRSTQCAYYARKGLTANTFAYLFCMLYSPLPLEQMFTEIFVIILGCVCGV